MVIGDDTGFSDPSYIQNVGVIAQGVVNRTAWDIGKPGSATYRINEMYKAKTGVALLRQEYQRVLDAIHADGK